jgi:hypothetical protein
MALKLPERCNAAQHISCEHILFILLCLLVVDDYGHLMAFVSLKIWQITRKSSSPNNTNEFIERESCKNEFINRRGFMETCLMKRFCFLLHVDVFTFVAPAPDQIGMNQSEVQTRSL